MSSLERRQKENAAVRARILAAARRLFLRHGLEAVSMRKIAAAIHYTPAALYVHFKDKEELVRSLMDGDFSLFHAALFEASRVHDPVERLRAIGRAYVRFALEHPHHYRLMFMTPMPCLDKKHSTIQHGNPDQDGYAFLRSTVQACIADRRFSPRYNDLDATTLLCWSAAHSVVSLAITHGEHDWVRWPDPQSVADQMLDALIDGMTLGATNRRKTTP